MIIDTHIHLDTKRYQKDLETVLNRSRNSNIKKFIIPSIDSNNMDSLISLSEANSDIYFASGHHPNNTSALNMEKIISASSHSKCIAIGECGLDWFRIPKGAIIEDIKIKQVNVFKEQIKLAQELNKPLILHSRDTDIDMVNTLSEFDNIFGVVHCYVGSKKLLELINKGFYFGIGGVITYSSAKDLRKYIKDIPLERLVLETDGPYLTPEPFRNKRNEPVYLKNILDTLSNVLEIDKTDLEKKLEENTYSLFGNLV